MPHEFPELENIEKEIRADLADTVRSARKRWPNTGIMVFVTDLGNTGGFAWGSTVRREDAVRSLIEWLHRDGLKAEDEDIRTLAARLYARTRRLGMDRA